MLIKIEDIQELDNPVDQSDVESLANSIKEQGLLHSITVHKMNGAYRVIAGNKRLKAMKLLGVPEIECVVKEGDLSPDDLSEIQIHENLKRYNLPWYEQVELTNQLHLLRQRQKGAPKNKRGGGGIKTGWSMRDTALELGQALGTIAQDIQLANLLASNPHLKHIKDKTTALKVVKQMLKRHEMEEFASIPRDIEVDQIYLGESASILSNFPDNIFDACITDPPWLKFMKDDKLTRDEETLPVFKEIYRTLKIDSFLYLFVGMDDFIFYREELGKLGFQVQQYPMIWNKGNQVTQGTRQWEYFRNYELITLAVKGRPALTVNNQSAFFDFPPVPSQKLVHPNEKPVEIIKKILAHCTYEKSLVLDPFAGSGVLGRACKEMGRSYILIERELKYYKQIERALG